MKKIVIIGAGPAGLSAAYKLLLEKNKYEVIILEEENNVGGISKTIKYKSNRMDMGGHRFFSKNTEVMNFWEKMLPIQGKNSIDDKKFNVEKKLKKGGPDPEKEDNVMLVRNRVSRIYSLKKFFNYPITLTWETFKNLGFNNTMKAGLSYLKSLIFKKEETNLENFYINRFGNYLYKLFFKNYTEKLWKRSAKEIDASWGTQRVKGLSIKTVILNAVQKVTKKKNRKIETSLIEEFWYPKYGPGQLWETVSEKVKKHGGKILLNHRVTSINVKGNKIMSVTCNYNDKQIEILGDIFISSMPLKDLVLEFSGTKIPKDIYSIAEGLPYIDFQTVGVLVKKMKLENKTKVKTLGNIVPDCWIYIHEPEVKMLRMQIFNNWSPYMLKNPENTVWLGLEYTCRENDEYWNMSDEEFCDFAIDELVKMNIISKDDVIDHHREKVKKAYPAYFDTYKDIDKLINYLNKYENLYCIGRNGQHRYNNMDHSVLTAFEAVNNIEKGIKNKKNIWSVNAEKEYHETKN